MREILFRGKMIDTGAWVEGAFCMKDCDDPFGELLDRPSIIKYEEPHSGYWFRVDPETVGQFTGLKDKNGKKIFEGDIISDGGMDGIPRIVRWYETLAQFECPLVRKHWAYEYNDVPLWSMQSKKTEVIGNIHDNPELLEGGAEDGN